MTDSSFIKFFFFF
uniref:Uncharacterized protein n=1 Tax=Anguilla anguilla TaxID=7936 RepID=A0A0E9PJT7_ANGAN